MIKFKLKTVLYDKGMTLTTLIERTGIRPGTLTNISTGKIERIPVHALDKICDVLNCQPGDLIEYEREKAEHPTVIMFKAESKVAGLDEWKEEAYTEEEFDKIIKDTRDHYKSLGRLDKSLTVTASVVEDGEVIYFNQLV